MTQLSHAQLEYLIQFIQPEKTLAGLPGAAALDDALLASLFGIDVKTYSGIKAAFRGHARQVAQERGGAGHRHPRPAVATSSMRRRR
ncbi:hypothetical protein BH24DEI1_BH24DEI1_12570 [soil metagenome]|jgi:hypothetical protein|nr:hypothetical protein [Deinococcota bacterium]